MKEYRYKIKTKGIVGIALKDAPAYFDTEEEAWQYIVDHCKRFQGWHICPDDPMAVRIDPSLDVYGVAYVVRALFVDDMEGDL